MDTKAIIMHDGSTVSAVIDKTAKGNEVSALYFLQIASALIGRSDDYVVKSGKSAGTPSIDPDLIKELFDIEGGADSDMAFLTFRNTYVKKAESILRSLGFEDDAMGAYNYLQDCRLDRSITCWNLQTVASQIKRMFEPTEDVTEDVTEDATEDVAEDVAETQQDKLARLQQILAQLDSDSLTVAAHMVEAAQVAQAAVLSDDRIYNEAY